VGEAASGTTSVLAASGRERGIYTVRVSAPGFASLTSAPVFVVNPLGIEATEDSFRFWTLGDVSVVAGFAGTPPPALTIPATLGGLPVAAIGVSWVFSNSQLTSVTIPASVTAIGHGAFSNNQLTSVTIPSGVINIGSDAFNNNQLTSIDIPSSVTVIGDFAFNNNQLTSIDIPSSVTVIGDFAFSDNQLTNVTIPSSVTVIGYLAFADNQLTSVNIPASVFNIGGNPFANNPSLQSITVSQDNQRFRSIDGVLYDIAGTTLLVWPGGKSPVDIPNTVTVIGDFAFSQNQLTSVVIPSSVTSIGGSAFQNNQLENITIPSSVTSIGTNAFNGNGATLQTVTIPFATLQAADDAWGGAGWRNGIPAEVNWVFEP